MKTKTIKKQNTVGKLVSLLLLITLCFSCDNEDMVSNQRLSYSIAEQNEMINLAKKYNVDIQFKEEFTEKKMSLDELEKLLQSLANFQCEFPIPYTLTYGTSAKVTVPQTRQSFPSEHFTIVPFTVTIEEGESITISGTATVSYILTGTGKHTLCNISGHVSFYVTESSSEKGYRYGVTSTGSEQVKPTYVTIEQLKGFTGPTISTLISIGVTNQSVAVGLSKRCDVSVPSKQGEPARCSIW